MKNYLSNLYGLLLVAILMLSSVSCKENSSGNDGTYDNYNATTQELINLVESDSRVKALLEEAKSLPWNAVWDYFCLKNNIAVGEDYIAEIQQYERDVTSKR